MNVSCQKVRKFYPTLRTNLLRLYIAWYWYITIIVNDWHQFYLQPLDYRDCMLSSETRANAVKLPVKSSQKTSTLGLIIFKKSFIIYIISGTSIKGPLHVQQHLITVYHNHSHISWKLKQLSLPCETWSIKPNGQNLI